MGPLSLALGLVQVRCPDEDGVDRQTHHQQKSQEDQNGQDDLPLHPLLLFDGWNVLGPTVGGRGLSGRLLLGDGLL